MKILLTGMTSIQVGISPVLKYAPFVFLFRDALTAAGHEVVHKKLTFDEDLTDYDAVVLGYAPIGAMGARWAYPTLWALDHKDEVPIGIILDDWKQKEIISSFRRCSMDDGLAYKRTFRGNFSDLVTRYGKNDLTPDREARIMHAISDCWNNGFPPMIGCYHDWSYQPELVFGDQQPKGLSLSGIDPTMVSPRWAEGNEETYRNADHARKWILASLSDYQPWVDKQKFTWPVEVYGNRRHGLARITEEEVFGLYTQNWGVLAPPYYHAGSAWWRVRYLMAADSGAIIFNDVKDQVKEVPQSAIFCPKAREVEQMSDSELHDLMLAQSHFLFAYSGSSEAFIQGADNWVRGLAE